VLPLKYYGEKRTEAGIAAANDVVGILKNRALSYDQACEALAVAREELGIEAILSNQ
jgi:hypothetical protein